MTHTITIEISEIESKEQEKSLDIVLRRLRFSIESLGLKILNYNIPKKRK